MTELNTYDLFNIIFTVGCVVVFALGCIKGGQG